MVERQAAEPEARPNPRVVSVHVGDVDDVVDVDESQPLDRLLQLADRTEGQRPVADEVRMADTVHVLEAEAHSEYGEASDRLDRIFHALAHPVRRSVLALLAEGEKTMGELAAPFGMTLPAVTKHILVLEEAGLIRRWRRGRTKVCGLEALPLVDVMTWILFYESFWEKRLDSLQLMFQAEGELAREANGDEATDPASEPDVQPRKSGGGKQRATSR